MRRLLLLFCSLFGASESAPSVPCPAVPLPAETAWLCHSRVGGWVPRLGPLHHTSVAICPCGELPVVVVAGQKGFASNPRCAYVGTQPRTTTFLPEEARVGVVFVPARLPAEVVKHRIATHDRLWRWRYNCQHAAAEATGHAEPRGSAPRP